MLWVGWWVCISVTAGKQYRRGEMRLQAQRGVGRAQPAGVPKQMTVGKSSVESVAPVPFNTLMDPNRRDVMRLLATLGVAAGSLDGLTAQIKRPLRTGDLEGALRIGARDLPAERFDVIRPALQQALDEFAPVRALELDDAIGVPVIFTPIQRGS